MSNLNPKWEVRIREDNENVFLVKTDSHRDLAQELRDFANYIDTHNDDEEGNNV